jgi:hypothetical protein
VARRAKVGVPVRSTGPRGADRWRECGRGVERRACERRPGWAPAAGRAQRGGATRKWRGPRTRSANVDRGMASHEVSQAVGAGGSVATRRRQPWRQTGQRSMSTPVRRHERLDGLRRHGGWRRLGEKVTAPSQSGGPATIGEQAGRSSRTWGSPPRGRAPAPPPESALSQKTSTEELEKTGK